MNIDISNEIIIDDIPSENRKTKEVSPLFQLALWIDRMIEQGTTPTGAQAVYKLSDIAGGDRIDIPYATTLDKNVSKRLHPQSF